MTLIDGRYCAYFELPRFCWDTPINCKVLTADGTTDLQSNQGGDLCEMVGTTSADRQIWRWTGPTVSESQPVEIIFTNHDLLTDIMPFSNGGYYNYASPCTMQDRPQELLTLPQRPLTEASPPFGGGPLGTTCRVANSQVGQLKRVYISIRVKNR